MPKGRIPIPAVVKELTGRRNRRAQPDVAASPGVPPKPALLIGEASREWDRVAPILASLRVLSEADLGVLTAYCLWWAEFIGVSLRLVTVTDRLAGNGLPSGLARLRIDAFNSMMKAAAELGLTPSARARIAPAAGGERNPVDEFLSRGAKLRLAKAE